MFDEIHQFQLINNSAHDSQRTINGLVLRGAGFAGYGSLHNISETIRRSTALHHRATSH